MSHLYENATHLWHLFWSQYAMLFDSIRLKDMLQTCFTKRQAFLAAKYFSNFFSNLEDKLVEIAYLNENIAGTAMASSYGGQATPSGNFLPDVMMPGLY